MIKQGFGPYTGGFEPLKSTPTKPPQVGNISYVGPVSPKWHNQNMLPPDMWKKRLSRNSAPARVSTRIMRDRLNRDFEPHQQEELARNWYLHSFSNTSRNVLDIPVQPAMNILRHHGASFAPAGGIVNKAITGASGSYNPRNDRISINPALTDKKYVSVLAHELTHKPQHLPYPLLRAYIRESNNFTRSNYKAPLEGQLLSTELPAEMSSNLLYTMANSRHKGLANFAKMPPAFETGEHYQPKNEFLAIMADKHGARPGSAWFQHLYNTDPATRRWYSMLLKASLKQ